jgi:hypothetical protein
VVEEMLESVGTGEVGMRYGAGLMIADLRPEGLGKVSDGSGPRRLLPLFVIT